MRYSAVAFLMILTTMFLSACEKQGMADLDDRGNNFYGRSGTSALANNFNAPMQQVVPTLSVSSNDLAAPTSSPAASAPFQKAAAPQFANQSSMLASNWQWPVDGGQVTEKFGPKESGVTHEGIVITAAAGTPIKAVQAGEVAFVGDDEKNYGNIVILRHANGVMTSYSHASEIIVKKGDKVAAGKTIAYVGQTGNAKVPQLHFAVRDGMRAVDPLTRLPQHFASN